MAEDEKKEGTLGSGLKFWLDVGFKVLMLIFGIVSFFGYFDLTGKIMGTVMLFFLWLHFSPVDLMFGKSKKWLNYAVIIVFYIFVLDTFTQIIQTTDTAKGEFRYGFDVIDRLLLENAGSIYSPLRQLLADIHSSSISVSGFSSYFGFIAIIFIALYITFFLEWEKDSLAYPLTYFIKKDQRFWENVISRKKTAYLIPKFLLGILCLLLFSHYFFNLVNQWMLVTIGNSTFIIAFFFAVKDLKNTGIKLLDKIGGFDEELIYFIRKVFHDPRLFLTGFSILLAFHYLSDINLFFVPYLIPSVDIDPYYLSLVGQANHLPVISLLLNEANASLLEIAVNSAVYLFSVLGAFFIFFIPVAFIFMSISRKNVKDYLERRRHRILLYLIFVSMTVFILSPWISMRGLYQGTEGSILGIYGVDLNTQQISESGVHTAYVFLLIMLLLALCAVFSKTHWMQEYSITIITLYSLIYLGIYVWYFFTSAAFYYYNLILFAFSGKSIILFVLFAALLLMETLFYAGGFFYMGYRIARYIITQKTKYIITDNSMVIWTIILTAIPALLLFQETYNAVVLASIVIASLLAFNFALYKEFTGFERKDDYIFSVSLVIAVFQILVIAQLMGSAFLGESLLLMLGVILLLTLSLASLKFFSIELLAKKIEKKDFVYILVFGAAFGILFYFVPDPFIAKIGGDNGMLLVYLALAAIAEEVLFRGVVMNVSEKAFSLNRAIFLQSLVFTLVHFISLSAVLGYYTGIGFKGALLAFYLMVYAVLLYSFGMFVALLYRREKNIMHPILFHFIVNLLPFIIYKLF